MKMKIAAPILFLLPLYILQISSADDTINPNQSFKDGQTLLSAEQIFELGFFSPNHSTNRYLGIWYHSIPIQTVVWVANRGDPLLDLSGTVTIKSDGNLVLRDGSQKLIWSTNTSTGSNRTIARLLDNGNLVLADGNSKDSEIVLWQSFDHPSNTLLPGMKLGLNKRTQENRFLVSWKTVADPSLGAFSYGLDVNDSYQFFIWNGSAPHWRSGFWNRRSYNEIVQPSSKLSSRFKFHFNTMNNDQETYFEYSASYNNTRLVMDVSGQVKCMIWLDASTTWEVVWSQPRDPCSAYDICGVNSKCNDYEKTMCECLPDFEPVSPKDWNSKDWTHGCKRKRPLECGRKDGFLALGRLKVPDGEVVLEAQSLEMCRDECSNNCSCHAFVYANMSSGGSCLVWSGNLIDIGYLREDEGSEDIYLRVMESDLDLGSRKKGSLLPVIVSLTTIMGIFLLGTIICCLWRRNAKRKGNPVRFFQMFSSNSLEDAPVPKHFLDSSGFSKEGKECLDIPSFSFGSIAVSANHFSESNMLGKGGFGPVYKGKLPDGQEIAVKRLSKNSGQGLEEFQTEVILIAKLQHRNLVRLLGYSIKGEEKLLLYEYMPNKSLDSFLFDPHRCNLLDWKKRYSIILGIARGLLYLHQDSRLRIIHRDLKTGNILLDEELNPKISDFGMARIFGGNQTQGNTTRVMGTFGYMSPEYALDGLFSVKSDIFSFGVILLEIVSGKKNNNFYHSDESLSLLGYAWKLWKEDKGMDITYACLSESTAADRCEMLKCIQLALLCVQEDPADRPIMASIVTSLVTENASLPMPKQPPSYVRKYLTEKSGSSRNQITVTQLEGR